MERFDLKRVLEIALGVFIGALGALMVIETWHMQKETAAAEAARAQLEVQAQARREEAETLKGAMRERTPGAKPPAAPDDADEDPEDADVEDNSNDAAGGFGPQSQQDEEVEELDEEEENPAQN